jgi:hypothetical protein
MPHRPPTVRTQRPDRIILRLIAPRLQNLRLAAIQFRIHQLLHLGHRLQGRRSLLHNPMANLIENLLHFLIHTLAIHNNTPIKSLNGFPSTDPQHIPAPEKPPPYSGRTPGQGPARLRAIGIFPIFELDPPT